jgi:hypothetical protein
MTEFFQQCVLTQDTTTIVTWLPEKFCKVGRKLQLKDNDKWSAVWIVNYVNPDKTDNPPDYRKQIRKHRENTGDSMPKNKRRRMGL